MGQGCPGRAESAAAEGKASEATLQAEASASEVGQAFFAAFVFKIFKGKALEAAQH